MTIQIELTGLIALMSIPSAITGFCFWLLQKNITKRDAERNKREEAQKENELLLIRGVSRRKRKRPSATRQSNTFARFAAKR